jgi:NAD(P)-dependent dehydrogenase (short-subunit alcohol dehydrogenase family)
VAHEELAGDGIRTVAIVPGRTDTPGMRDIVTGEYTERVAARYPGGRLGLTAFLCSDAASQLSGTMIMARPPVVPLSRPGCPAECR